MEKRLCSQSRFAVALPVFLFEEGFPHSRPFENGTVFNISEGGCKITTQHPFKVGDSVALRFYVLSHHQQIRIHKATVCWVQNTVCRLEFDSMQRGDQERLQQFILELEQATQLQPA